MERLINLEDFGIQLEVLFASFTRSKPKMTDKAWFPAVEGLTFNQVKRVINNLKMGEEFPKSYKAFKLACDNVRNAGVVKTYKKAKYGCIHCQYGHVHYLSNGHEFVGRCSRCETRPGNLKLVDPLAVELAIEHKTDTKTINPKMTAALVRGARGPLEEVLTAKPDPATEAVRKESLKQEQRYEGKEFFAQDNIEMKSWAYA